MTSYQPQSKVGWLDSNDEAAKQMAETIRALQEPSTLDPLGFGSIRNAFADLLAPGTSTIQTRVRYFLFVPWICQSIENSDITASQFNDQLRNDEAALIECLKNVGQNQGVQGLISGIKLKRMPSSTYWGGLYSWGLRNRNWSIAEYGRNIARLCSIANRDGGDETIGSDPTTIWTDLPSAPDKFLEADIDFNLTSDEAQFIIQKIRESHPESLLAAACENPQLAANAEWAWEVDASLLTDELNEILFHARNISEVTLGAQLIYNLLIARRVGEELKRDVDDDIAFQLHSLNEWAQIITDRQKELSDWFTGLESLWTLLSQSANISKPAQVFTEKIIKLALNEPFNFIEDRKVHELVIQREKALKGPRARFVNLEGLKEWNGSGFGGQLNYRWPICKSYLTDLADALNRDN